MPDVPKLLGKFLGGSDPTRTYEPQRSNAGYFFIPTIAKKASAPFGPTNMNVIALAVDTFKLPSFGTEPIQLGWMNEHVNVAGKSVVDDMDVVLKDYVAAPVADILEDWFLQVYNPVNGAIGYANEFKKTAYVYLFATDGSTPRWYELDGCFISKYARGDVDQNTSDYIKITITLSIDRVIPNYKINSFGTSPVVEDVLLQS